MKLKKKRKENQIEIKRFDLTMLLYLVLLSIFFFTFISFYCKLSRNNENRIRLTKIMNTDDFTANQWTIIHYILL